MNDDLDQRLVERWQTACADLGINVIAPVTLQDAAGITFRCEAFLRDFGSKNGTIIVSAKTERRIRKQLRNLGDSAYVAQAERKVSATYNRNHVIAELQDHGWHGKDGDEPDWYSERHA